MKFLFLAVTTLFAANAFALDPYTFKCDVKGTIVEAVPGNKKAPEHPVVGLQIKVLKNQVPLFLIKAKFGAADKNMFVTDWTKRDNLSQDGLDLLELLSTFMEVKTDDVTELRAGLPTDLLEKFAYLELKRADGTVTKLGFEGSDPYTCQ